MQFKLRAECDADVDGLIMLIPKSKVQGFKVISWGIEGEVIATLQLNDEIRLEELRTYMCKIEDSELMTQTVNYEDQYTGERYYKTQTKSKTSKS